MAKPTTADKERRYFEQFQKAYTLPAGSVVYGDKPDVILHGTKKIGIEITSFFPESGSLPESEQRQKPLRNQVVQDAQKRYLADGGRNIEVTVSFDKDNPITPTRMKNLSDELAALVHRMDNGQSRDIEHYLFRESMPEILSAYINVREYTDARWRLLGFGSPELMSKDDLTAIVREKESKSDGYEKCDECWLLICIDGMDIAQDQEPRIDDPHVASDVFEKIFVYHTFGHIVTVK